jgi:hypothetical protein
MMKVVSQIAVLAIMVGCMTAARPHKMERVVVSPDRRSFALAESKERFTPWGLNYGNHGRLIEDFWETDWATVEKDFRDVKTLGANVLRVHLQFGRFMDNPTHPHAKSLEQLAKLLHLAERTGVYLDLTGLACYRKADVPRWYDELNDGDRWAAQAVFWQSVAHVCASSPAVFCYDLINEPLSQGGVNTNKHYYAGELGGLCFIQWLSMDSGGRTREQLANDWIEQMTQAIRSEDRSHLITIGLLPWDRQWHYMSGIVPTNIASHVDFISVHIYPETNKPDEAMESLRQCVAGKPIVIEETFPLHCPTAQLERFLVESQAIACGWMGHYDGMSLKELDDAAAKKKLKMPQAFYRAWLKTFVKMNPNRR